MTHTLQPLNVVKPVALFLYYSRFPATGRCGGVGEGKRCEDGLPRSTHFGFYYPLRSFSLGN